MKYKKGITRLGVALAFLLFILGCEKVKIGGMVEGTHRGPRRKKATAPIKRPAKKESTPKERRWGRYPFISSTKQIANIRKAGKKSQSQRSQIRKKSLSLSGILWKGEGSLAIIDDKILRTGDVIDGEKIIAIEKARVVLQKEGKEIILNLK